MASYSIREMSLLSDIQAHTIRIWEKRYNLFTPQRTSSNIRRYSDDELKLLLNVSFLLSKGYKISKIANLSSSEISSKVKNIESHDHTSSIPRLLLDSALKINPREFSEIIDGTIAQKGVEWTYEKMLTPFQQRMGLLWQAGTISSLQVHFSSHIIREKIISYTALLPIPPKQNSSILLFLPEGELHELGLLYFNFIARQEGFNTLYLGQTAPFETVADLKNTNCLSGIMVSITSSIYNGNLAPMFDTLGKNFPQALLMATGLQVERKPNLLPKGVKVVKSARSLRLFLKKIKG